MGDNTDLCRHHVPESGFFIQIVPEPVGKWQDVGANHHNILESFYKEPERYAYTFQNYVFVTRLMQERESAHGIKPLRLMERSVFSDRMVSSMTWLFHAFRDA